MQTLAALGRLQARAPCQEPERGESAGDEHQDPCAKGDADTGGRGIGRERPGLDVGGRGGLQTTSVFKPHSGGSGGIRLGR